MRRAPIARSGGLKTRPRPAASPATKEALAARSGGWCEAQLPGCLGQATDACHRIARKAGGRPEGTDTRLSNLWHGCRACHRWATERPTEAYDLGLALKEYQDPSAEPMAYRNWGWILLDDEGSVTGR